MTGKETELQREMHEMAQKTAELKEEFIGEKNRLTRELTVMSEEIKSSQVSFSVTGRSDHSVCAVSLFVFVRPATYPALLALKKIQAGTDVLISLEVCHLHPPALSGAQNEPWEASERMKMPITEPKYFFIEGDPCNYINSHQK